MANIHFEDAPLRNISPELGQHQVLEEPPPTLLPEEQKLVDMSQQMLQVKMEKLFQLEGDGPRPKFHLVREAFEFVDGLREGMSLNQAKERCDFFEIDFIAKDTVANIATGLTEGSDTIISKEKIKNYLVNKIIYDLDVKKFANENKDKIIQAFGWQGVFHGSMIDPVVKVSGGESHNEGRKPAIITFSDGIETRQFVFKPRNGEVDQKIIELFQEINASRDNEIPPNPGSRLPTYKIITTKADEGWTFPIGLHHVSLSEYVGTEEIVGQHKEGRGMINTEERNTFNLKMHEGHSLEGFLQGRLSRLKHPNINQAMQSVGFLASVLAEVGSHDQHNGNFRFDGRHDAPCPIIPIDMEVIELKGKTDIRLGGIKRVPLSEREKGLVNETRNSILNPDKPISTRYLLIGTSELAKSLVAGDPERFQRQILLELEREGIVLSKELQNELLFKVTKDLLNQDIPIFSKAGEHIYYGEVETGLQIK